MIDFWLKLWNLTRPYRGRFLLAVFFGILSGAGDPAVLVTVVFVASVVLGGTSADDLHQATAQIGKHFPAFAAAIEHLQHWLNGHVSGSKVVLGMVVSLVPLVMLARGLCNYLSNYLMSWVTVRATADLRTRVFEHLLNLPLSFLTRNSTGELMSRIGDVGILQSILGSAMVALIQGPINLIILAYVALRMNAEFTIIALVTFPLCAIPVVIYNKKVRKAGAAMQTEQANLGRLIHETFTGNRIVKGYNLEQMVVDRFKVTQRKFISQFMRAVRATETPGPVIEFLGSIGLSLLLFYVAGKSSPVEFAIFVGALLAIYRPLKQVIRVQSQLHQAKAATDRVFELLATQSTLTDPPDPAPLRAAGAEIHFDNVSFDYGDRPVLHRIQLRVEPGRMVALVGASGSGKTTLTNLLLRFYDPTEGAILIGGTDVRRVTLRDLRSQVAVVTQEVILFNETIRQNIACGRQDASLAEIEEAARHAFAHDFILEKPRGYESVVGEKGTNLSGGQRQRIAIARAILKNAPILVLDEATSSLDNESERVVQAALDELMKGRTTICVAHRLSTIHNADLIVVLEHGKIVETGRHEELLARDGIYKRLHALGFQDRGTPEN